MSFKSFIKKIYLFSFIVVLVAQTGCVIESISGQATSSSGGVGGSGGEGEGKFDYIGCVDGQGVGTKSIELNFLFPEEALRIRLRRNGNQIAEFSRANAITSHIDDDGLREGATYLYTCEALVDGVWSEGTNNLQLSTLAINAPVFIGITAAVEVDPHSVKVTWESSIADDPVSAYSYKIFANVGSNLDWTAPPRAVVLQGSPAEVVLSGLGDELNYVFGVRACSEGDTCETNTVQQTVFTSDGGAPLTTGASKLALENGILKITAPWTQVQGGISRRYIYVRKGATGGTNIGDYVLEKTYLLSGDDLHSPPQELDLSSLQEGQTYNIIVQDEDPTGNRSVVSSFQTINVVDITPPSFGGILNMVRGVPADSVMSLSWIGIATELVDPINGGDKYRIFLLSSPSPITSNSCVSGVQQEELNVSNYTAQAVVNFDLIGLSEKLYHSVCIKVVDLAGNISTNNNSLQLNTLDITPPDFIGIQGIAFNDQSQFLDLSWNASTASDIKEYKITLWANQSELPQNPVVLLKSHAVSSTGASISNTEFSILDNDDVYALVEACDMTESPFGVQNCSTTGVFRSTTVFDVTPPPNFIGIKGPSEILTPREGEFTVKWNAPADWTDYRGFRVYQVDPLTNVLTLMRTCPCADYGCSDNITQCTVNGLDSYRTYRLHVRAYDNVNNETLYLDPVSNYSDKRTIDSTAPIFDSKLTIGASPTFVLSWDSAIDNQYASEPGAEIRYEIYSNNAPFDFLNPSRPSGNLKTSTTMLSFQDSGLIEAQIYYYTVCAKDASNNTTCDQLTRNLNVPDVTPPSIINLVSTKTIKSKVWELEWEMSDNTSDNADLQVEIRRRVSEMGDLAANTDEVVYRGLGSTLITNGTISTANALNLDPLSGPPDLNRKINYLLIVRDEQGNESRANVTVDINNILTITSVKGTAGPVQGNQLIVVYGTGFSSDNDNGVGEDTEVLISGKTCTNVNVLSEKALTCITPQAQAPGGVEVRVRTKVNNPAFLGNIVKSEDTLSNGYTYSFSPTLCEDTNSWDTHFAAGSGESIADPYIICDETHLANVRQNSDSGKYYKLGKNIDLMNISFDPLGNTTQKFSGNFDGDGHIILNWTYNNAQFNVGFLGHVIGDFQVSNLGLVNVDITATQSVGGIIGVAEGGNNKTGLISNVFVTGNITAEDYVGGLIGRKSGEHLNFEVTESYFIGTVTASGLTGYGGGIVGLSGPNLGGVFSSIYSEGMVTGTNNIGGLFGNLGENKQLKSSFSRAVVQATGNTAGGLVGEVKSGASITNSYTENGAVLAVDNVGGIAGTLEGTVINVYSKIPVTSTGRRAGGVIGYASNASISNVYSTANHNVMNSSGGLIGEMLNSTLSNSYATGGLVSGGSEVGGLIGKVSVGELETSLISKSYSKGLVDTSFSGVGGLIGSIDGASNSTLSISEVFSTSQVGTNFAVQNLQYGGLVGKINASSGSSVNILNCYSLGAVYAGSQAGGLIGGYDFIGGSIIINNCYSASAVLGGPTNRGGVLGKSDGNFYTINNSFWDKEVSTKAFATGNGSITIGSSVSGHTTMEMQDYDNSIYTGWDFITIWIVPVNGYPQLRFIN